MLYLPECQGTSCSKQQKALSNKITLCFKQNITMTFQRRMNAGQMEMSKANLIIY